MKRVRTKAARLATRYADRKVGSDQFLRSSRGWKLAYYAYICGYARGRKEEP